ncbi:MAG: acetyl-CoA acetyltransferase [Corynebacterium sp.]|uniref:acetyl-CoA acetyltransferase n=1 Tax=Corynebacterium sp. TaxID=1720 RepID=UPI0026DBCF02|nr:acetyl-CoA acetyltransferase [Corynebacterium sp.]MDO4760668.1 acetyl-CoA acetyltransferase [Corynebacterium sp.]
MITASPTFKRSTYTSYHRAPARPKTTTRTFAEDPFFARFGHRLPAGLRDEARNMQWRTFMATYAPAPDMRLHLGEVTKLRGTHDEYHATLSTPTASGRKTIELSIIASGPVSAATHLLADAGRRVEILSFHQYEIFESTATFILVAHNKKRQWALGFGGTRNQSAASALSTAAYLLHR